MRIGVTIFAALTICLVSTPRPSPANQKTADNTQQNAQPNKHVAKPSPSPTPSTSEDATQNTANQKSADIATNPNVHAIRIVSYPPRSAGETVALLCTILLTVAGVIGIIVAICTLRTLEKQAEAAKISADAAKLNAQAVINSERAWIEIDLGAPEPEEPDENGDDDYSRYSIQVENRGRTVAHIKDCLIGSRAFGGEIRFEEVGYRSLRVFSLLGSNQRRSAGTVSFWDEFSRDDWAAIQSETKSAVVRITVKYRDAVNASESRETSVVFTWNARNERPERMPAFDEYK